MLLLAFLVFLPLTALAGWDQVGRETKPVRGVRLPDGTMSLPTVQTRVLPRYPEGGRTAVRGFIDIEVVIGPKGEVAHARVSSPLRDGLDQETLEAAKQCKFQPAVDSGRPLSVLMILRMQFEPPGRPGESGSVTTVLLQPPRFTQPAADLFASAVETGPKVPGSQAPKPLRAIAPNYTSSALRARIQGRVDLQAVVLPDGTVGAVRILKSLDERYGLDQQATEAAGHWFFEPGTLNGVAVATRVRLLLDFRLQ